MCAVIDYITSSLFWRINSVGVTGGGVSSGVGGGGAQNIPFLKLEEENVSFSLFSYIKSKEITCSSFVRLACACVGVYRTYRF